MCKKCESGTGDEAMEYRQPKEPLEESEGSLRATPAFANIQLEGLGPKKRLSRKRKNELNDDLIDTQMA